jgi:peptidoglycan/LPS O-acetylase OafA/YrhL
LPATLSAVFTSWAGTVERLAVRAGACGVDLFFCLSAYLISEILLREQRLKGSIDVRSFYVRLILRIWPLYFAFLAFMILAAPLLLKEEFVSLATRCNFFAARGKLGLSLGPHAHSREYSVERID